MSRPQRVLAVAALVAVAVVSYIAVSAGFPGSEPGPAPRLASTSGVRVVVRGERPRPITVHGYAADMEMRSEAGAVRSAVDYLELVDRAPSLTGAVSQLRAMTLPPFTERVMRAEAVTLALTSALDAGGAGLVRGWRLGWRVTAYGPTTALVAVWSMGIVESPAEIVAPDWSTTVCVLRWSAGGWRVVASRSSPGPTPPPVGANSAAVAAFVGSATGFHSFADAP